MYLLFTEDDGWHTNQITEALKKNNKDFKTIKINESSILVEENPKLKYQNIDISFKEKIGRASCRERV